MLIVYLVVILGLDVLELIVAFAIHRLVLHVQDMATVIAQLVVIRMLPQIAV